MPGPFDLQGKRALVTGGSRGFGRAIAAALADGAAAVFFASPAAGFITGQTLMVDGGTSAH